MNDAYYNQDKDTLALLYDLRIEQMEDEFRRDIELVPVCCQTGQPCGFPCNGPCENNAILIPRFELQK